MSRSHPVSCWTRGSASPSRCTSRRIAHHVGRHCCIGPFVSPKWRPMSRRPEWGIRSRWLSRASTTATRRVAFAQTRFGESAPTVWTMALAAGQDSARLGPDEYFGYGVDSRHRVLHGSYSGRLLSELMNADRNYYDAVDEEMQKTHPPTASAPFPPLPRAVRRRNPETERRGSSRETAADPRPARCAVHRDCAADVERKAHRISQPDDA